MTKEMTNKEIKNIISNFKKYLQKNNTLLKVEKGSDPFIDNCYTSSSNIVGVYFPNTKIIFLDSTLNSFYDFVCIGKNWRNEEGFVLQLKSEYEVGVSLSEYIFQAFKPLDDDFFKIKDQIENDIKDIEKSLIMLSSFKQVYKKDGSPFKDYNKNFIYNTFEGKIENPGFCPERSFSGTIYSIKIYFHNYNFIYYLNKKELENKYIYFDLFFTFEKCLKVIQDQKEKQEKRLWQLKEALKNLEKLYNQAKKLKTFFNDKKEILNSESYYYLSDFIRKGL